MIRIAWDEASITGLRRFGIVRIVTECDETGNVWREVGFNSAGKAIHFAPGSDLFLFDNQVIHLQSNKVDAMTAEEFESAWAAASRYQSGESL